jgi:nucleoid-associated protein YgaU
MPSRYNKSSKITNDSDYYAPLRESRGDKKIVQYATQPLRNPTVEDRRRVSTTRHIWKYGDRYYNLAQKYYGDSRYWWVIAWWNSYPTEALIENGKMIYIPLNLEQTLRVFGI